MVERGCRDLDKRVELYLDDKKIELPSIESIVVLNIPSWGAGVHLWNMGGGMCISVEFKNLNFVALKSRNIYVLHLLHFM